jgi:hypothetical protein
MAKRLAKLAKDNPNLANREEVKEVAGDIDTYAALAAFASSEAGSILTASYGKEIAATVQLIANGYKTLPEAELRALGAQLEARLNFLHSLSRARTNLDDAEAILKELIV